jgi:Flp pilus assembly protein TadD
MPLFVAAVWCGEDSLRRRPAFRSWAAVPLTVLVAALAFSTRQQTARWRDDLTLFSHAVSVTEGNWKMHFNLGNTYRRLGQADEAERQYLLALAALPDYPEALNNLGTLYAGRGEAARAEELFIRVVSTAPGHVSGWMNLGQLYEQVGDAAGAADSYRRAVALLPGTAEPRLRLGRTLLQMGSREEALVWCRQALELEPTSAPAAACTREASNPR